MKGLVLAGGYGTRLRPLTFTGNKHMIPVANQPILFYGLRQLARAGIRDVAVILGPIREGICESVGDGHEFGLNVTYIEQGHPRGLAHAVLCARAFLGEDPFVMYLGDNLLEHGVTQFVDLFNAESADAVIGVTPVADPQRYGVVQMSGSEIVSIEEKPRNPQSNLALVGIYVFSRKIHPIISALTPSARGELEITDAIRLMHRAGGKLRVQRVFGWWKDTGAPEDLLEANDLILDSTPPSEFRRESPVPAGATLSGPVAIGADSVIEPGVRIDGPVVIGSGVHLAGGTTVGPGTAIGNHVELRGCSVRRSIILEATRVSGPVRLRDSLIGRSVDIHTSRPLDHELVLMIGDASRVRI